MDTLALNLPDDPMPSTADQLEQLSKLHSSGALTDAEFSAAKAKLLAEPPPATESGRSTNRRDKPTANITIAPPASWKPLTDYAVAALGLVANYAADGPPGFYIWLPMSLFLMTRGLRMRKGWTLLAGITLFGLLVAVVLLIAAMRADGYY